MKKAVIFDLDGTLIYTLPDISRAMNKALSAYGLRSTRRKRTACSRGTAP